MADRVTETMIEQAAHELASQERYNPSWVKPADFGNHHDLYKRRVRLILEAAFVRSQGHPAQTPEEA